MTKTASKKIIRPGDILTFVFKEESRSGMLLIAAAILALLMANGAFSDNYFNLLAREFSLGPITLDFQHWINEGLMALFFLVVGIEVKREFIDGELKGWRKASFPIIAAAGGMLVPALIFSIFNPYPPQNNGWGIPMATDIAIAVGVLALLARRIPRSLRVFLLSLAIIDDIGSIAIIGLFYTQPDNMLALLGAVALSVALAGMRNTRYWYVGFFVTGILIWYCLMLAGVSGTMAGIIVALLMPLKKSRSNAANLQTTETIEDILIPVVSFIIVPLFVFSNAGLKFSDVSLASDKSLSVFIGVSLGLLIGKPVGILVASWMATKLRLAHKPYNVNWGQITGVGFLAGIGFTISILISGLSYSSYPELQNAAVLGIFSASVVAGFIGLTILRLTSKKHS